MISLILVLLIILLTIIFIGTPIAFALGGSAVLLIILFLEPSQLLQVGTIAFAQSTSMNQLVAPLFILMAELVAQGGIARDLFNVLDRWLRPIKAGLALSTMLASTVFAALCGSSPATAAAMGRISIKEMTERGYQQDFAAGVVAVGGTLGIMIPPSLSLVIFGIITENSIAKLFIAGVVPGLLTSALLCLFIWLRVMVQPELVGEQNDKSKLPINNSSLSTAGLAKDVLVTIPPFILIFIVLGSLYSGIATPTEAAGFGAVGAFFIVVLSGRLSVKIFTDILSATAKNSTMILFIIIGGMVLSYVVSHLGIAREISDLIISSGLHKWTIMILIYILWLFLGCLMDPLSMIVLTIPFLYPTLIDLGFHPIWLGIVSTLCVEIGMITPPVGLNLFVLNAITDVPMSKIMSGALPFVFVLVAVLSILSFFPQICLYLPAIM